MAYFSQLQRRFNCQHASNFLVGGVLQLNHHSGWCEWGFLRAVRRCNPETEGITREVLELLETHLQWLKNRPA